MIRLLLAFILFSPTAVAQVNLNAGLIVYLPFNGSVKDQSGLNNDPIANNTSFTTDRFGNKNGGCYFNGKSSYLRIPNNGSLCPKQMSIVAIIKPVGFYNGLCYNNSIVDKGAWDYQSGVYSLRFTAGEYTKGNCYQQAINGQNFVGATATNEGVTSKDHYVQPGTWYCVVFTVNEVSSQLYLDGELITSRPRKVAIGRNDEDLFIGKKDNGQYPYWFNGVMDEIRIYNRALSSDEILALCPQPSAAAPCTGANKPDAKFSFTINDCNNVAFKTNNTDQKNVKSIQWYFGDGSSSSKKYPAHVYAKAGTYKIRSIITTQEGCSDTITRELKIQSLTADFTFSEPGQPGTLSFRAKNNSASYVWDFGDGSNSETGAIITHQFAKEGIQTVRLFAIAPDGCRDTVVKQIGILLPQKLITDVPLSGEKTHTDMPSPLVTLEKRDNDIVRTIHVENDSISIALYDNGMIDGDSITLLFNRQVLASKLLLGTKPFVTTLKIDRQLNNELTMYAENLGSIPPNTALLIVNDGNNRYMVNLSSSKTSNAVVSFILRQHTQ